MTSLDFRAFAEAAPGLFLVLLPDAPRFTILAASDAYLRATMTQGDDVVDRGLFEVFPDDPSEVGATGPRDLRASLARVIERRAADSMPRQRYDIRRPGAPGGNPEERYWRPLNAPLLAEDGSVQYIIHHIEDVTDIGRLEPENAERDRDAERQRERADWEAAERRRVLSIIGQAPAILNYLRGPELVFEIVHPKTIEALGGRPIEGKPLLEAIPEHRGQPFADRLRRVFESGQPFVQREERAVFEVEGHPRESFWTSTYLPVHDSAGKIDGVLTFDVDVTEQVGARRATEEASARIAQMLVLKTNLFNMVSHELRTPLTSLTLQIGRLTREDVTLTDQQGQAIRRMALTTRHLAELVDSLLDYARIEQGPLETACERCDVGELAKELGEELVVEAEDRGLELRVDVAAGVAPIQSDRRFVRLVLANLMSNALKFTERGRVEVTVASEGDSVEVRVEDTGPGIAPKDWARIFEPFEQLTAVRSKHARGVGLGLALVKNLLGALGGRIALESAAGEGTRFTVTFPSHPSHANRRHFDRRG